MLLPRVFLTADWRYLAMLHWRLAPGLLLPYVPRGTELDTLDGHAYASVVGFLFQNTRVLGVPVPFHRSFEEVNLRVYVRRAVGGEVRRAVVFVRELVPRAAVTAAARLTYNEPYRTLPMRHRILRDEPPRMWPTLVEYSWRQRAGWGRVAVEPVGEPEPLRAGSEEEFLAERPWGYSRQRDGGTVEYRVEHPRWRVWQVRSSVLEGDLGELYGPSLGAALAAPPHSAFLAEGSGVTVYAPLPLPAGAPGAMRQMAGG